MTRQNKAAILVVFTALMALPALGQTKNKKLLNVTGSYKYSGKTYKKGGDIYGYYGSIDVKQLEKNRIAVSFYLNKGAKSYNSGSFVDTLELNGHTAVYKIPECDSACTLTFQFSTTGVRSTHRAADGDYNFSCCFGQGVIANGYFKKVSNKTPIIRDQAKD